MSIYPLGEVIRRYRKELKISQEKLSEGICSVATLSRIENGERLPNKANFDAFMQRMGQSGELYDAFISAQDFEIHEKKFHIRQLILKEDFEGASQTLDELEMLIRDDIEENKLHKQFVQYMRVITENKGKLTLDSLEKLESAIKITLKNYGKTKIYNYLLTYDEIVILNNIAVAYGENEQKNKAIQIYGELKEYMEDNYINSEEKMRMYPSILYNLSKYLGLAGRYQESIDICDLGIESLNKYGRVKPLSSLLYNKAWCILKLKDNTRMEECKKTLLQAYYVEMVMGSPIKANQIKEFSLKHCPLLTKDFY